jgi:hypothetical protein
LLIDCHFSWAVVQHKIRKIVARLQAANGAQMPDELDEDPGPFPENKYRIGFFQNVW